ncbi:MAG: short-chain fatty acid transporter [Planctomycetota bacterium]|nr:MAG: short-chain fatty acid transporter [Planctomycetota bacterium]
MLSRLSARLAQLAQQVVPDPFVIALALTLLATLLGLALMPNPDLMALASGWMARVLHPGTLAFTTQMALVLVAGATLARAPLVAALLGRLAAWPRGSASAAALTAAAAMSAAWLNWGFGLVVGAVLAREIGERARAAGRPLDYPLVGAAGYTGLLIWHGGLSGSAPLKVSEVGPAGGAPIPLGDTIFSSLNLVLTAAMLLVVPLLLARMARRGREWAPERLPAPRVPPQTDGDAERRPLLGAALTLAVVALGVMALIARAGTGASLLDLNTVILLLLLLGLLLFGTPQRYGRVFCASAGEAGGILLQFPFYFGILGLLEASGMVELLASRSADLARGLAAWGPSLQWSFDMVTFASAGLVNLFVPSGGGQWAVQGAIVARACEELALPLPRAVMALSFGDEWTNMLQPFWALALLGITGLKARDILGDTLIVMLAAGGVFALVFALA